MFDSDLKTQLKAQAHIWLAVPEQTLDPDVLSDFRRLLSEDELARHQRFRFDKDKQHFLVSHALLRTVLSKYADVPPQQWQFDLNSHGRPELAQTHALPWLRFNLSHTNGLVACVVTELVDCGVDVENLTRHCDYRAIARKMFSDTENECLEQLIVEQQSERFFSYWTLKEAYVKARGLGLSLPTNKVSFEMSHADKIGVEFDTIIEDVAEDWQFTLHHPVQSHVLATAIRSGGVNKKEVVFMNNIQLTVFP
jgi:4'-phosphopantetheinyl transferase